MNFFFGFSNSQFKSNLTIPKFQNNSKKTDKYFPFELTIKNENWIVNKSDYIEDENFFFLKKNSINNDKIFFLSNYQEVENFKLNSKKLTKLNNFTDTIPVKFRSNFRISYKNLGFSSYQSEYPYEMTQKKGSVLSPIYSLLNSEADENYILFRNIYENPIKQIFKLYLVDVKLKKILNTFKIYSNYSNLINVEKKYINENTYLLTDIFIGIPIFISLKNNHLSMEHTHPPHHYILSDDKFKTITKLKTDIKNAIFK